eukprot:15456560-Alexandrium_andersonii.AAC.1
MEQVPAPAASRRAPRPRPPATSHRQVAAAPARAGAQTRCLSGCASVSPDAKKKVLLAWPSAVLTRPPMSTA